MEDQIAAIVKKLIDEGVLQPTSPWFDTREAGAYVHLSASHLANLRSKGKGPPFVKREGRVLYHKTWLDHWLMDGGELPPEEDVEADEQEGQRRLEEFYRASYEGRSMPK